MVAGTARHVHVHTPGQAQTLAGAPTSGVYAEIDFRMAQLQAQHLRLRPAFHDGQLTTLDPVVRLGTFSLVAGPVAAVHGVFHALTPATHVVSLGLTTAIGLAAATSPQVSSVSRQLDALLLHPLQPVAARMHRLGTSPRMHRVRHRLRRLRSDVAHLRFVLTCGAGRFAGGFASVLALSAAVSMVTPLTTSAAFALAVSRGLFSWAFPHVDDRYRIVDALEHRLHALRSRLPLFSHRHAHTHASEDACPFPESDPRRRRHLSLREARRLAGSVLGPSPPRASPDRRTWFVLARLLKKTARGGPERVWLPGHGAAEAIAALLAGHAATVTRATMARPAFDLRAFGDVVAYATASALRHTPGTEGEVSGRGVPAALLRVPIGRRPAPADAGVLAGHALGGATGTNADRAANRATARLLTRAVRRGEGLRLGFFARRRMARQLCAWTDRTQAETADLSLWEPRTARALSRALDRHVQAREGARLRRRAAIPVRELGDESVTREQELARQRRNDPLLRTQDLQRLRRKFPTATTANSTTPKAVHATALRSRATAARPHVDARTGRGLPPLSPALPRRAPATLRRPVLDRLRR